MSTPAFTLKLKKYRQHFGVLSPRVVVRRQMPRALFWLLLSVFALVVFGLGWFVASYWGGRLDIEGNELRSQLQQNELLLLRSVAGSAQNALEIEREAHRQLLLKIGVLEDENAALKEEVKILERLMPLGAEGVPRNSRRSSR